ncbi:NAD(P)H-binding protein [Nocardia nova]|uniref:NAD(P)H-binding protein n=1 Tax=Nocardia nova TaxID=37330 RepID=UPI002738EE29|nr:NAD(P)H-binding protein [Nocardia nova]
MTAVSRRRPDDLPHGVRPSMARNSCSYLLAPGSLAADVPGVLTAARDAGVRRIVLLSSQGIGTRPDSASHGQFGKQVEVAVQNSGLEWTILRPSGFQSNVHVAADLTNTGEVAAVAMWADAVRTQRTVTAPFGDVAIPFVDPDDIAAVAATALREAGHTGRTYVLTGPAPESPRDRARALAETLGEPVRFVEQTAEQARAQLLTVMPADAADTTLAIIGAPTPEELRVSDDVEAVLGRAPRPFSAWARRNIDMFR